MRAPHQRHVFPTIAKSDRILAAGIAHLETVGEATNRELMAACDCCDSVWTSDRIINHNTKLRDQKSRWRLKVRRSNNPDGGQVLIWSLRDRNADR